MTVAHFVVSGEFITEQARSLWNDEDEPEKAMNLLRCLHGISEAQCLEILEGKAKLVGASDSGVELVADNVKGKSLTQIISKLKAERNEAQDERADLIQMSIDDTVCVASPTGLRKIPRRKATRIKNRETLADPYEFDDIATGDEKKLRIWQQMEQIDPAPARTIDKIDKEPAPSPPVPPEAQDKITCGTGWLSPEGKFYPCGYAQHAQLAWALGLTNNPANHGVEPAGWVRLGVTDKRQYFFGEHALFSAKQIELIRAFCAETQAEQPYWLNDK